MKKPTSEQLDHLISLKPGDTLTDEDVASIRYVWQAAGSLYVDNSNYYEALRDIRDERGRTNGRARMARRAAQALGDRA